MTVKLIDADVRVDTIWMKDPAIDEEQSDLEAFAGKLLEDPGCWREHIKTKSGQRLTQFRIGVIPPGELNQIEDDCRDGGSHFNELRWRCFLAGLYDIIDGPTEEFTRGGKKVREAPKLDDGRVDPVWLSKVFCRNLRTIGLDIGLVVWRWNQLGEADSRP